MNPLEHFGIKKQFIRGDTSSYNYYPGAEYEDGMVHIVDHNNTNKMKSVNYDKKVADYNKTVAELRQLKADQRLHKENMRRANILIKQQKSGRPAQQISYDMPSRNYQMYECPNCHAKIKNASCKKCGWPKYVRV